MRRLLAALFALGFVAVAAPALAETTLEKISGTGVLTVGTRRGSPPFGFVNKTNEWVGFSIDLVEQAIKPAIEKKLGKAIRVELKESTPATRIQDIAGRRVAAQQGSTNAKIVRERVPTAELREFPDQPAAFQALAQGQVQAYTNDGIQLAGLKAKAPRPAEWEIVGDFYSYEPFGMAMRKNESDFRAVVNNGLMDAIESGQYFELYEKWFGPKGEVPYPLTPENRRFLLMQVVPK